MRLYVFLSSPTHPLCPPPLPHLGIPLGHNGISQHLPKEARDVHLQVTLADLVVYDIPPDELVDTISNKGNTASTANNNEHDYDTENGGTHAQNGEGAVAKGGERAHVYPGHGHNAALAARPTSVSVANEDDSPQRAVITWGVRFAEEGSGPIVVDVGGAALYDEQVEAQMAAAAAQASGTVGGGAYNWGWGWGEGGGRGPGATYSGTACLGTRSQESSIPCILSLSRKRSTLVAFSLSLPSMTDGVYPIGHSSLQASFMTWTLNFSAIDMMDTRKI